MRIVTNRGTEHDVDWIDPPITMPDLLALQMTDARPVLTIAAEFDGLTRIERFDENQGDKVYEGFSELIRIDRMAGDTVMITLRKGACS